MSESRQVIRRTERKAAKRRAAQEAKNAHKESLKALRAARITAATRKTAKPSRALVETPDGNKLRGINSVRNLRRRLAGHLTRFERASRAADEAQAQASGQ